VRKGDDERGFASFSPFSISDATVHTDSMSGSFLLLFWVLLLTPVYIRVLVGVVASAVVASQHQQSRNYLFHTVHEHVFHTPLYVTVLVFSFLKTTALWCAFKY